MNYNLYSLKPSQIKWLSDNIMSIDVSDDFIKKFKAWLDNGGTTREDLALIISVTKELGEHGIWDSLSQTDVAVLRDCEGPRADAFQIGYVGKVERSYFE